MTEDQGGTVRKPRKKRKNTDTATLNNRSRISNGTQFLPAVHEQSVWARTARDSYAEILSDHGGADQVPWTVRQQAKHTSVLSAELDFLAAKIGKIREDGGEPEPQFQELFTRLLNAERRQCELLGLERRPKDIGGISVIERIRQNITEQAAQARAAATDAEAGDV